MRIHCKKNPPAPLPLIYSVRGGTLILSPVSCAPVWVWQVFIPQNQDIWYLFVKRPTYANCLSLFWKVSQKYGSFSCNFKESSKKLPMEKHNNKLHKNFENRQNYLQRTILWRDAKFRFLKVKRINLPDNWECTECKLLSEVYTHYYIHSEKNLFNLLVVIFISSHSHSI